MLTRSSVGNNQITRSQNDRWFVTLPVLFVWKY